jgi:DNA-binding winged helix-turn-helix (wHTH) protein
MVSFRIGPWRVDPFKNVLEQPGHRLRVEPKAMRVLVHLAERAGEAVTREEILRAVWGTSVRAAVLTRVSPRTLRF